ncbi:cyclic nucleotide-binding domain-containing protein [Rubrobacter tropicus]|uniref:Cyclic nucleotide-binding domain-containing protein n=1 Tax=Rubrobacter tropicus TaxID=2653851 RepID=A0A6G8QDS1_9ACTN|nr:Crp/Fnr family transcriptional regulator [Rubrobacter tropicus]QIN84592.1 cyclic nucleotide-binding domain-containing protein [Rubrobacter tropicus]
MVEVLAERTRLRPPGEPDLDARLVEFVAWAPVLQGLPEDARDALVRSARIVSYPRRTAIFHEGDEPTALYGVVSGAVKVYRDLPSGRQRILEVIEPGRAFAVVPALDGRPLPASAMTLPDSELAVFPRRVLMARLRISPEAMLAAIRELCGSSRDLQERLWSELSYRSVPQSTAALLLRIAEEWGRVGPGGRITLELPLTRTEMAESLGAPRESVSRALSALVKRGIISLEGDCLTILEPDLLRRRSGRDEPHGRP